MPDRRSFLASSAALALASAYPQGLFADAKLRCEPAPKLPPGSLYEQDEERYWAEVRRQFLIPEGHVYLNNGTVGSSPRPVLDAVIEGFNALESMDQEDPERYPIWGYEPYTEFREVLAKFIGATVDTLALVRNATEANSYIANGLELQAGDEVLISDQEHPSGEQPWKLRAKRHGVVIRKFELPKPPKTAAEILDRINDAITPRTRVIFVSHISTVTGLVLPVKDIATLARDKGILSAFDGAHVPGMMRLNVQEIGCDMYTASPHKWLQAPKGSGFLYVREEVQPRLWNTITTHGWDDPKLKAERFMRIGSSNVAMLWGLGAAVRFAEQLGLERIEKRHRKMADYIHAEMTRRGAESWTASDPSLRCAITCVNVPPIQRMDLENWLWSKHRVRIRGGEPSRLRLSTPYYLLKKDIDKFLTHFDEYKRAQA